MCHVFLIRQISPKTRLPLAQAELAAELGLGGEMAFTVRGGAPLSMTQAQVCAPCRPAGVAKQLHALPMF